MPKVELDDVEKYLVEQSSKAGDRMERILRKDWLRKRFVELRAREESKSAAESSSGKDAKKSD